MPGFKSNRRTRTRGVPEWLRKTVLKRDRGVCQIQGPDCTHVATQVDHIIAVSEGGKDKTANCQSVCEQCHKPKTQAEAQRGRDRVSRKRPARQRPGSIKRASSS